MSFYSGISSARYALATKKPVLGYVRTGPSVFTQASPTGNPNDAFHVQYPKTALTATIGSDPPVLQFLTFSWVGGQGTTSSQPTWTWKSTSAKASSITYNIYRLNTNVFSGGYVSIASGTLAGTVTTIGTSATTATGYCFMLVLVASNAGGTATFRSDAVYNSDATATLSSFSWVGGIGTLTAQPTWIWTIASIGYPTSVPDTLTYQLYADASVTPTTLILSGSLTAGYGNTPATTLAFTGATLLNKYYKFNLYCNGTLSFTNTQQNLSSLTIPVLALASFVWGGGGQGTNTASPKWTWANNGGVADSITASIYGDASATPTTLLNTSSGDNTFRYLEYTGATVGNYYYKIIVNASNGIGSATPLTDTEQNTQVAPTATLSSFAFDGTQGSTTAYPHWYWSYGGGAIDTYAWTVYGDASSTPTTVLASGTSSITDYQYVGATVGGYYYKLSVAATNVTGSGSFTDTRLNLNAPGVSITASGIGSGTAAAPYVTAFTNYGAAYAADTLAFKLYVSKAFVDPGTAPTGYNLVVTSTITPSGSDSYTYSGTTVIGKYYRYICTATNAAGSTSSQTVSFLCASS